SGVENRFARFPDVHPHRGLIAFVTDVALVLEMEFVAHEMTRSAGTNLRRLARRDDGDARRNELAELGGVEVSPVADPPFRVSEAEPEVRVDETEHAGRVDHHGSGDVTRMAYGVNPLAPGEGQRLPGRHTTRHRARVAIDDEQLVEQ